MKKPKPDEPEPELETRGYPRAQNVAKNVREIHHYEPNLVRKQVELVFFVLFGPIYSLGHIFESFIVDLLVSSKHKPDKPENPNF